MNKLKRSGVIGGKIRTVTNAQHGRILQLTVEQAHDMALAVFVDRGCGFVEKDPAMLVQEEPREGEAPLLAQRKLIVPALEAPLPSEMPSNLDTSSFQKPPQPVERWSPVGLIVVLAQRLQFFFTPT
jgi:hypothetical protein